MTFLPSRRAPRLVAALAGVALSALALSACASGSTSAGGSSASADGAEGYGDITLQLSWILNEEFAEEWHRELQRGMCVVLRQFNVSPDRS